MSPQPPEPASHAPAPAGPSRRVDNRRALVCALAVCAGSLNLALAFAHLGVHEAYALVLLAIGVGQALWTVALYRSPSLRVLAAGALVNLLVALWFGVPSGALLAGVSGGGHGAIGPLDLIASGDEIVLAVCAVVAWRSSGGGRVAGTLRALVTMTGLFFVLISSLVLAAPEQRAHGRGGLQYGKFTFYCPFGEHGIRARARAHQ